MSMPSSVAGLVGSLIETGVNVIENTKARDYNTPAAQMSRLQQAGLNPNLMYGSINNSPAVPAKSGNFAGLAAAVEADQRLKLERELNDAQIRNLDADTANKQAQNPQYAEIARQLKNANDMQELFDSYIKSNPDAYYKPQIERFQVELDHIKDMDDIEKQRFELDRLLNDANILKIKQDITESKSRVNVNNQSVIESKARTALLDKDLENYVQRFLTQQEPWYAKTLVSLISKKFGLDTDDGSAVDIIESAIDQIQNQGKEVKEKAKLKINESYFGSYDSHDNDYNYGHFRAGRYKGKKYRVRHSDGLIELID